MKQLTVVQVLPALEQGGVERGAVEMAEYLQQQGHRPLVISAGGRLVQQLQQKSIQHIELPVGKKSLFSAFLVPKLRRLFRQQGVDVVHARSRLPAWLCLWALSGMRHRPVFITTIHGLHSVKKYSSVMARGDRVIAVSQTASDYLQSHYADHLKQPPCIIYRGIDPAEFPYAMPVDSEWLTRMHTRFPALQDKKTVLLPGRLTALKGAQELLPWLRQATDGRVLLLTATPEQSGPARRFHAQIMAEELGSRVVWVGNDEDIRHWYALADVVVSCSVKPESFGRTVIEALAMGRPVVGYDHGGVAETLRRIYPAGCVKCGDKDALSTAINRALTDPVPVPDEQPFTRDAMLQQTLEVYAQAVEGRHV